MRSWKLLTIVPTLLVTVLVVPCSAQTTTEPAAGTTPAAKPTPPPKHTKPPKKKVEPLPRTAWMLGLGAGFGYSGAYVNGQNPDANTGGTTHLRVGYAATPTQLVGVDISKWSANPDSSQTGWSASAICPTFTWFRGNMFLRGGLGYGTLSAEKYGYVTAYDFNLGMYVTTRVREKVSDDGFAWLFAGGYEWRYGRRLGIAPQAEYLHITAQRALSANVRRLGPAHYYW